MLGFLRALTDLVLPVSCAGCGAAGDSWCWSCRAGMSAVLPVTRASLTDGPPAYALAEYRDAARDIVLAYKERGRRELAGPLGGALAGVLPRLPGARPDAEGTWWLVPAPSRTTAARRRGGDHVLRLARQCAHALSLRGWSVTVAPALALGRGVRDSVGLDVAGRAANLAGRVHLRAEGAPTPGTPVVLLDDVITTGATATACTRVLRTAGVPVTAVLALTHTP